MAPSKVQLQPLAPVLGTSKAAYADYLSAFVLYREFVDGSAARRTQERKDFRDEQRAAASAGCVVARRSVISVKRETVGGASVVVPVAVKETRRIPAVREAARSPEVKKQALAAKRRRYRRNKALKSAKYEAELSRWQLVATKNRVKAKAKASPKSSGASGEPALVKEKPSPGPSKKGKEAVRSEPPPVVERRAGSPAREAAPARPPSPPPPLTELRRAPRPSAVSQVHQKVDVHTKYIRTEEGVPTLLYLGVKEHPSEARVVAAGFRPGVPIPLTELSDRQWKLLSRK